MLRVKTTFCVFRLKGIPLIFELDNYDLIGSDNQTSFLQGCHVPNHSGFVDPHFFPTAQYPVLWCPFDRSTCNSWITQKCPIANANTKYILVQSIARLRLNKSIWSITGCTWTAMRAIRTSSSDPLRYPCSALPCCCYLPWGPFVRWTWGIDLWIRSTRCREFFSSETMQAMQKAEKDQNPMVFWVKDLGPFFKSMEYLDFSLIYNFIYSIRKK